MKYKLLFCMGLCVLGWWLIYRGYLLTIVLIKILTTKIIEENPSDLVEYFNSTYYGFQNIDVIICTTALPSIDSPYVGYANSRLGFFIPKEGLDTYGRNELAKIALQTKLYIYHNVDMTCTSR